MVSSQCADQCHCIVLFLAVVVLCVRLFALSDGHTASPFSLSTLVCVSSALIKEICHSYTTLSAFPFTCTGVPACPVQDVLRVRHRGACLLLFVCFCWIGVLISSVSTFECSSRVCCNSSRSLPSRGLECIEKRCMYHSVFSSHVG